MNSAGQGHDIELLLRVLRAEAAAEAGEAERRRAGQLQKTAEGHRAHIRRLDSKLADEQAELVRLRSSAAYRLGAALVAAIRDPRGWLTLPGTLLAILRDRRRAAASGNARSSGSPVLEFHPLPVETAPPPPPEAVELRLLPSAPPPPENLARLRVAAVLDPFSVASFAPDCQLLELGPDDWAARIGEFRPHLLLVESAWLGRDGAWQGLVERGSDALRALVASCRRAGLPTVFWNKEDPLHFEAFLESARLFDHVFTTDAASLPRYRREFGHDRVHLMPFALQPRTHHPLADGPRSEAAFFAGAWYGNMGQRSRDFRAVADAVGLALPLDIFDRNAGGDDPSRRFPAKYAAQLRGAVPYEQTPALYRGYRIGVNLNTVKDSPTMFARRVFELIGCNTSVYSNWSRGQKLLLGDLTVCSDDAETLLRAALDEARAPGALHHRRRRLLALRKVLEQHTWAMRLQAVARAAMGVRLAEEAGPIVLLAAADDALALQRVLEVHARQRGVACRLAVRVPDALRAALPPGVEGLDETDLAQRPERRFPGAWLAPLHPADHYGPGYLRDLALGRLFTVGDVLGKAAFHRHGGGGALLHDGGEYRRVDALALRRCLLPAARWDGTLAQLIAGIDDGELRGDDLVSLDVFSYAEGGAGRSDAEPGNADPDPDPGLDLEAVASAAARLPAMSTAAEAGDGAIPGPVLSRVFNCGVIPANVSACARRDRLEICSLLPEDREDALFSMPLRREVFERDGQVVATLDGMTGQGLSFYLDALDAAGKRLERVGMPALATARMTPPDGTAGYRIAVAVRGRLLRHVDRLWLGAGEAEPLLLPGAGRLLVVTNAYPEAGNLYRNAFVHRRVLEYRRRGVGVDVVVVTPRQPLARSYEFDGVPVLSCGPATLRATLATSGHAAIAVHFLDAAIWSALADAARTTRTVVWLHGAEIQPWTRRSFNHRTEEERAAAIAASDERMAFWRGLLGDPPAGLRLAFVSRSFAEDAWQDLGLRMPESRWQVIHNPIDTRLFPFVGKSDDQRFRVLSIRPHGYRIYANDLVAATIREVATHPLFPRMQFRLIGDGALFEENFAGLDAYPNVRIERRFLTQAQIAALHREYGVFLVPSRGDTQGVSRDEAMASGLVPVTNDVGAIGEFVDSDSGIVAPPEDVAAMTAGMLAVMEEPARFQAMSRAAAARVRRQSGMGGIVDQELAWLGTGTTMEATW